MLPSKIEDLPIFAGSKRPSKFHLFWHRFFIDFGSVLASNMGPSWEPRRLKIEKMAPKKRSRCTPRAVLNTNLLLKTFQEPTCLDFGGVRTRSSVIFWVICWVSWLTKSSTNLAKKIQELAEDKAENPRTCRGQSREQNPYERLQEN